MCDDDKRLAWYEYRSALTGLVGDLMDRMCEGHSVHALQYSASDARSGPSVSSGRVVMGIAGHFDGTWACTYVVAAAHWIPRYVCISPTYSFNFPEQKLSLVVSFTSLSHSKLMLLHPRTTSIPHTTTLLRRHDGYSILCLPREFCSGYL